ncbi:MAG TPA: DUF58 domain-containing protein [Smithellaceae bacterium]|nr:DUF58 domain-containing protein [Smithellaceae bacterium]
MREAEILNYLPAIKTKSVPTGIIFHRVGLIIFLVVLFVALEQNIHSFTVLISFVLALALIARAVSKVMLFKVHCRLSLPQRHFFPQDAAVVNIEIANNKFVPLFWIHAAIPIPAGITIADVNDDDGLDGQPEIPELTFDFSMEAFSVAEFHPAIVCSRRGYYPLNKLTLTSGDLFGLYSQRAEFINEEALVVYPRLYPIKDLDIFSLYPTGGVCFKEHLFYDHTRTMGVRDYCTNDEFRHIHWKASARRDRLQVKIFEPTVMGQMALFLPAEEFCMEDELETAICVLAAIAHRAIEQGNSVGLISNCSLKDSGKPAAIFPDGNKNKMDILLETFAKINPRAEGRWELFFTSVLNSLRPGTTFVFAATQWGEPVLRSIMTLKRAGYKVVVVHPGIRKDNPLRGEVAAYKYELRNGYIQCELQQ